MGAFARNRNGKTDITIYKLPRREGSVCATLISVRSFSLRSFVTDEYHDISFEDQSQTLLFLIADPSSMRDAYHIS